MLFVRATTFVVATGTIMLLGACQSVGPIEIGVGRDRYNSVLQSTGKVQTLANIVRVHDGEQTSFMDVTEIDAGTTLSSTVTGTVSGIGAKAGGSGGTLAGQVGSVTPGVTYTESPFIRYIPLVGQGLVSQLVTPVGVDALESLINSNWSTAVVLDLATSYIAPDFRYNAAATNIVSLLADDYQTATLVAGKSDLTVEQSSTAKQAVAQPNIAGNASKPPADDTLTVFRQRQNPGAPPYVNQGTQYLWQQLLAIYRGTQSSSNGPPLSIELRTVAVQPAQAKREPDLQVRAPVMKTYSALGIVQNAVEQTSIDFMTPGEAQEMRNYSWNKYSNDFYTLPATPKNLKGLGTVPQQTIEREGLYKRINDWLELTEKISDKSRRKDQLYVYEPGNNSSVNDPLFIHGNAVLISLRRYVVIVCDDTAPPDAYVAYFHEGKWYYIAGDDNISKKNFNLITLFLTVMAVPSSTAPVGTTISVGGG